MQTNLFTSGQSADPQAASPTANPAANLIGGNSTELFTKLLVAQIKNQNPLEPTDPSQFVNQLTQLSQTESLQQLVSQASASAGMLQSMQAMAMGAQVGSQVMVESDRVQIAGAPVGGSFTLANMSPQVALVLTGADGSEHRIELGSRLAGDVGFTIDPAKLGLAPGSYGMRVVATDGETPAVAIAGSLDSVKLAPGGNFALNVSNVGEVQPAAITQFNGRQTASASAS
jgi:flagellar basal-body rod modification protein FlgD